MKKFSRALGLALVILTLAASAQDRMPGPAGPGVLLPNGWTVTPFGDAVAMNDLITNLVPTPDGTAMVAVTSGYNPHGLVVIDAKTHKARQRIALPTTFMGLAFSPAGDRLYVSGGNHTRGKDARAPIYVFGFVKGRLSEEPIARLDETVARERIFWSGLAHHPKKDLLFAANRTAGEIVVWDTKTNAIAGHIATEVNPYDLAISPDGGTLYCSNWASDSVSVIDTELGRVTATIAVGNSPNDLVLGKDGRLFVACSNDNTVVIVDTKQLRATERIVTAMYERAPEGATPNALALDAEEETLFVANADNNNVCVVNVEEAGEATVLGFIPAGWYPSALAVGPDGKELYIGNGKGTTGGAESSHGPHSAKGRNAAGEVDSTKTTVRGTVNIIGIEENRKRLRELTQQAYANCPYNDELLAKAKPSAAPSVVPRQVGAGSPIKHVLYIIKENRTYDQVLGDLPQGNGDPALCLFGRDITPNQHKIAEEFVLLDNLYCDAEVSRDGHAWSNAAYATDFVEKLWPANYAGLGDAPYTEAAEPASGYLWDLCKRKGLTYRSYGEYAQRVSEGRGVDARKAGLTGHVAPRYLGWDARDPENAKEFALEMDEFDANYGSTDLSKRLPNFMVMCLPENHTAGTRPGWPTPRAAVASNDYGLGLIVERVSRSPYWKETAIFVIEDDSQDGSDHVDARRTTGFVISPYVKRRMVDSTFYTTSSMLRTVELLLGLPPMSQYDAAATPMYAALGDAPDLTPYAHVEPVIDLSEVNTKTAWGAEASEAMDWTEFDRTPMFALNEIIWKSVRGADSEMPLPLHRFAARSLVPGVGED
jgi:YVTN family beta-propeller protein